MTNKKRNIELSVVLPVYNESSIIRGVVLGFYREIISKFRGSSELIVAEDGSNDGTKEILLALARELPKMRLIMGERKKGYLRAAKDALLISGGRVVLFSDSDGQHDPRDFWRLYPHIGANDIVSGRRAERSDPLHRRALSTGFNSLVSLMFGVAGVRDFNSGFKLMRSPVIDGVVRKVRYLKYGFSTELLIRAASEGFRIAEVPVRHRGRGHVQGRGAQFAPAKLPGAIANQVSGLFELKRELLFS